MAPLESIRTWTAVVFLLAFSAVTSAETPARLEQAALAGDAEAQYQLAALYRTGKVVAQDDALTFKWMKAAAEKGHKKAQFNLGTMYLSGRGVGSDSVKGEGWLRRAAAQGHEEATRLLLETQTVVAKALGPVRAETGKSRGVAPAAGKSIAAVSPVDTERPALLDAAVRGQADAIKTLIAAGRDVNVKDETGNGALALAAMAGKLAAMTVLISAGAKLDAQNEASETALILAASKGHGDAVALLLNKGAGSRAADRKGADALTHALRGCHAAAAKALIKATSADQGQGHMQTAAVACPGEVVAQMITQGWAVDSQNSSNGRTALWVAADRGNVPVLTTLLSAHADASIADKDGQTPFLRALENRHQDAGMKLSTIEKNINRQTPAGNTALILAAGSGSSDLVKSVLAAKPQVDIKNKLGNTALMIAARDGQADVAVLLVAAGADRGLRNQRRERAADVAMAAGHVQIIELLR